MALTDIRFCNDQAFLHKRHTMTSVELERQIATIDYQGVYSRYKHIKDENNVEREKFPPINYAFFAYVFGHAKVPDTVELQEIYFEMYKNAFAKMDGERIRYNDRLYSLFALRGRILRTYPSLVRDFHFFLLLREDGSFEEVVYSCKNDINGRDIIIRHEGREHEVSLFIETSRSLFFKEMKNRYRHEYGRDEIRVPLNLNRAARCGDFRLYGKNDVLTVKAAVCGADCGGKSEQAVNTYANFPDASGKLALST